jgi:hypothetical protein
MAMQRAVGVPGRSVGVKDRTQTTDGGHPSDPGCGVSILAARGTPPSRSGPLPAGSYGPARSVTSGRFAPEPLSPPFELATPSMMQLLELHASKRLRLHALPWMALLRGVQTLVVIVGLISIAYNKPYQVRCSTSLPLTRTVGGPRGGPSNGMQSCVHASPAWFATSTTAGGVCARMYGEYMSSPASHADGPRSTSDR